MARLFTFGCSFTHWSWPTWADILGREFEQYENWGQRGAGNVFIFHSLIECYKKKVLGKGDKVVIMWSSYFREDRYHNGFWDTSGETSGLPKNVDLRGKYIETLSLISAARNLLEGWGVDYTFTSMVPINQGMDINQDHGEFDDVDQVFNSDIENIRPSMLEKIFDGNWGSRRMPDEKTVKKVYKQLIGPGWPTIDTFLDRNLEGIDPNILEEILGFDVLACYIDPESRPHIIDFEDTHPTPAEHLAYIDSVLPEFKISNETRGWVKHMNELLLKQGSPDMRIDYQFTQRCYDGIWSCITNRPERI